VPIEKDCLAVWNSHGERERERKGTREERILNYEYKSLRFFWKHNNNYAKYDWHEIN
jgi:hypothetical protein